MNLGNEFNLVTKTQDFETPGGSVYLVNNDYKQIKHDLEFLRKIERRAFDLVLSEDKHQKIDVDENKVVQNIKILLENIESYGTSLLVTEKISDELNIPQVTVDAIEEINSTFNCVIVNLNEGIYN